jgi:hypothetical protein
MTFEPRSEPDLESDRAAVESSEVLATQRQSGLGLSRRVRLFFACMFWRHHRNVDTAGEHLHEDTIGNPSLISLY